MHISIDWISDFVTLPPKLSAQEIANRFTLGTAEVEDVKASGAYLSQVKVVEVTKLEPHPDADSLRLVTFKLGDQSTRQVVCGAANVRLGMHTFYAPLDTTLPIGMTLTPKKIRGVVSEGMLCSEEELGLKDSSEGIMDLGADKPVGLSLGDYLEQKADVLLDVDNKSLTHRPDLWGHYGLAREFATLYEVPLKNPYDDAWKQKLEKHFTQAAAPVQPRLVGDSAGLAYFGLSLDGVQVKESPAWIKQRLTAVGLRPINNIVDISNYVMLELGHPLHIFDRDLIEGGELKIHRLDSNQEFTTLDEQKRALVPGDTVISDAKKPLVLAGIMGGKNSGVSEKTNRIFIEVANWKAAEVRKTSTRLGLRSDSSQRYEKTLDSRQCYQTLLRTLDLILDQCPKAQVIGRPTYDGENLANYRALHVETSTGSICRQLGIEVPHAKIVSILRSLGFKLNPKSDRSDEVFSVEVPSFRATKDVECEADLVEEIGRIVGFDHIPPSSPLVAVYPTKLSPAQKLQRKIRDFMVYQAHSFEVMTYPLIGDKLLERAHWKNPAPLTLINALSKDHNQMRPTMIPGLLEALAQNTKNFDEFRLFELGRIYLPGAGNDAKNSAKTFAKEQSQFIALYYHRDSNPFMDMVNDIERLNASINLPADLVEPSDRLKNEVLDQSWMGVHPFEFYHLRLMGKLQGAIFSLHPMILRQFKIKGHAVCALIDLTQAEQRPLKDKTKYAPLSKFPGSQFDYTVDVDAQTSVGSVLSALQKLKHKNISSHQLLDTFASSDRSRHYITFRSIFSDAEKTLTGEEIKQLEQAVLNQLTQAGFQLKQA